MPIDCRIAYVSSDSASNSLYICLKLSKYNFISSIGKSSIHCCCEASAVVAEVGEVGCARFVIDMGTDYGPPARRDWLP